VDGLIKRNESPYTRLIPNLEGVDPDEAFSAVPYEKGFAFLSYLENLLGGPGRNIFLYFSIFRQTKSFFLSFIAWESFL
jgi:leukotriene-A4 hydrolase